MDLGGVSTHELLQELKSRSDAGVVVLDSEDHGWLNAAWGNHFHCIGITSRALHSMQRELDDLEAGDKSDRSYGQYL